MTIGRVGREPCADSATTDVTASTKHHPRRCEEAIIYRLAAASAPASKPSLRSATAPDRSTTFQGQTVILLALNNSMTLRLNDTADTMSNILNDSGNDFLQPYKRTGAADIASVFGSVRYVEYAGGSGGITAFVECTPSRASLSRFGYAGA